VPGVHGTCLVSIGYSRLAAGPRLRSWILLVALTAAYPETLWTAVTIGRGSGRPRRSTLGPLEVTKARDVLAQLLDLYDRALREPLPVAAKTSAAYAAARRANDPPHAVFEAGREWRSGTYPGEDAAAAHVRVWGPGMPLTALIATAPPADERWAGEPSRFGEIAVRLWRPLLAAERIDAP
jgi:exodeoxyribonuclease V gamma subunit